MTLTCILRYVQYFLFIVNYLNGFKEIISNKFPSSSLN